LYKTGYPQPFGGWFFPRFYDMDVRAFRLMGLPPDHDWTVTHWMELPPDPPSAGPTWTRPLRKKIRMPLFFKTLLGRA